jgi:hypothetical protein
MTSNSMTRRSVGPGLLVHLHNAESGLNQATLRLPDFQGKLRKEQQAPPAGAPAGASNRVHAMIGQKALVHHAHTH